MKRDLRLIVNNDLKVELTLREFTALNLCRKTLEELSYKDTEPYTVSPTGEIITLSSAIEVFDDVLKRTRKEILK